MSRSYTSSPPRVFIGVFEVAVLRGLVSGYSQMRSGFTFWDI
jgi:hypothetical protein